MSLAAERSSRGAACTGGHTEPSAALEDAPLFHAVDAIAGRAIENLPHEPYVVTAIVPNRAACSLDIGRQMIAISTLPEPASSERASIDGVLFPVLRGWLPAPLDYY
jgi:hypothetical protein